MVPISSSPLQLELDHEDMSGSMLAALMRALQSLRVVVEVRNDKM